MLGLSARVDPRAAALAVAALVACAACGEPEFTALPPLGSVEGYLCDPVSGELAAGATVTAPGDRRDVTGETDATGFFRLDDVLAGDVTLAVVGAGGSFETEVEVTVVEDELVRLPDPPCLAAATGTITGRICALESQIGSGEGYYLAAATVTVDAGGTVYTTTSDAEGYFTLAGVPAGTQTLLVTKGSFAATDEVIVPPDGTVALEHVCIEPTTQMAVLTGEFDSVEAILEGLGFGLRACNTPGIDGDMVATCPAIPDDSGSITLYDGEAIDGGFVPQLLMDGTALGTHEILFFNCGLRDELFEPGQSPPEARANLRAFVENGGSIYVSDFAYEVLRSYFPDAGIAFYGDDGAPGAAKVGQESQSYTATVDDPVLAQVVGATVPIVYDGDAIDWVVLDPVQGPGVTVHVSADVEIDPQGDGTTEPLAGAPLLVSVPFGAGRIAFTTFHNHDQTSVEMRDILRYVVFEL